MRIVLLLDEGSSYRDVAEKLGLSLDHAERYAFVMACRKIVEQFADGRLVAPLEHMLAGGRARRALGCN
jgi:hypothetical protein